MSRTPTPWRWATAGVALYLALAAALVFGFDIIMGDALSRVGNAHWAMYSRDPKLSALGFVWTPLPAVLTMPLLLLKRVAPSVATLGFASNIVAAAAMVMALVCADTLLRDWNVRRPVRIVAVILLALHPMIVMYGANGMTEGLMLALLLGAAVVLGRWLRTGRPVLLTGAGMLLAAGYLARYEVLAAAAFATVLVFVSRRQVPGASTLVLARLTDAVLLAAPVAFVFVAWAAASWVIIGEPFSQLTSAYGNSAQVGAQLDAVQAATGPTIPAVLRYQAEQMLVLTPWLPVVVVGAVVQALRRRDLTVVPVLGLLISLSAFHAAVLVLGPSFAWLRFQIAVVPLTMLVSAHLANRLTARHMRVTSARARTAVAVVATALVGGTAIIAGSVGMLDSRLGRGEADHARPLAARILGADDTATSSTLGRFAPHRDAARVIDARLDRDGLDEGAVLTDVVPNFAVVLAASDPRRYVITPDRDFRAALSYPERHGIRYVLVTSDTSGLDVVATTYPMLYSQGVPFGRLVEDFPTTDPPARLYRVDQSGTASR